MPMLILDDTTFKNELIRLNQCSLDELDFKELNETKVIDIKHGRNNKKEIPEALRAVIAEEAITNGHTKELAKTFDISKSSVDAYKNGATSTTTYHEPNKQLEANNDIVRTAITNSARSALMNALSEITSDKIAQVKVKDAASIAKDMSSVVKNMEPQVQAINQNNTQVIVYKPRMREEDEFEVITVNE